jgi:primase-polymerase (primpol)-like protein
MEEIIELREHLEHQRFNEALQLALEMEDMSRSDKITRISSFAEVLLMHLIKQAAEQRTTRSWDLSIEKSAEHIADTNARYKSKGVFVGEEELHAILKRKYQRALKDAAAEAFGGAFSVTEIAEKVQEDEIIQQAFKLIISEQNKQ